MGSTIVGARFPTVDLRALVLAGLAVTPSYSWLIAANWWEWFREPGTFAEIAFNQVSMFVTLFVTVVGCVVSALGGALFLQTRGKPLRPSSFVTTALVISALVIILDAVVGALVALNWYHADSGASSDINYNLMSQLLNDTALMVAVGISARLYLAWRLPSPDDKDTLRFIALAIVASIMALFAIARWTRVILLTISQAAITPPISTPLMALSWATGTVNSIIVSVGTVFLWGSMAIALLRRAQAESNLFWATIASTAAVLASDMTRRGSTVLSYLLDPGAYLYIDWLSLASGLLVAGFGGAFYLYVVDRDALRRPFASFPKTFTELRQWPYRPGQDE